MELLEAIGKRRSVRAYREGRIARETVLEVLRAGTLAPSGKNGQPGGLPSYRKTERDSRRSRR